jgi:predicted transcriptional regulator
MVRPKADIPIDDVLGLKTLRIKGWSQVRIAEYYGVSQSTVSERIKEMDKTAENENEI